MVEYQNGKVYKLVCNKTGLVYVGSTTQALSQRKAGHVRGYQYWEQGKYGCNSSFQVIENGDFDIVLLEEVECDNKEQLHRKEREWIERLSCVNKVIPTRTNVEYREQNKEAINARAVEYREQNKEAINARKRKYYKQNKEAINARAVKYREQNREAINARSAEYREQNREAINARAVEYREQNKEAINAKTAERVMCPCGVEHRKGYKARHQRTAKHQEWAERLQMEQEDKPSTL